MHSKTPHICVLTGAAQNVKRNSAVENMTRGGAADVVNIPRRGVGGRELHLIRNPNEATRIEMIFL